jgi:hypothetical protein
MAAKRSRPNRSGQDDEDDGMKGPDDASASLTSHFLHRSTRQQQAALLRLMMTLVPPSKLQVLAEFTRTLTRITSKGSLTSLAATASASSCWSTLPMVLLSCVFTCSTSFDRLHVMSRVCSSWHTASNATASWFNLSLSGLGASWKTFSRDELRVASQLRCLGAHRLARLRILDCGSYKGHPRILTHLVDNVPGLRSLTISLPPDQSDYDRDDDSYSGMCDGHEEETLNPSLAQLARFRELQSLTLSLVAGASHQDTSPCCDGVDVAIPALPVLTRLSLRVNADVKLDTACGNMLQSLEILSQCNEGVQVQVDESWCAKHLTSVRLGNLCGHELARFCRRLLGENRAPEMVKLHFNMSDYADEKTFRMIGGGAAPVTAVAHAFRALRWNGDVTSTTPADFLVRLKMLLAKK